MLSKIARQEFIDEVIVATLDSEVARAAIREAQRNQLGVRVAPELFGYVHADEELDLPASVPLLNIYQPQVPEWALAVKRVADVVLASLGMLALLPVVLAISVAIKLDSSGSVLYRAPRVGRRGRRFQCYKFRTMVARADVEKDGLRSRNERDGAFFKIANDPRITRIGGILRRYSLARSTHLVEDDSRGASGERSVSASLAAPAGFDRLSQPAPLAVSFALNFCKSGSACPHSSFCWR